MSQFLAPRQPRERSHRPQLRAVGAHAEEILPGTLAAAPEALRHDRQDHGAGEAVADRPFQRPPMLRAVDEHRSQPGATYERSSTAPVLLVGADAPRRAILRAELAATLPRRTRFFEADDVATVLERAPFSRMMILAGDLDDADADSLMRLLSHRHPRLPVVCVRQEPMPAVASGRG